MKIRWTAVSMLLLATCVHVGAGDYSPWKPVKGADDLVDVIRAGDFIYARSATEDGFGNHPVWCLEKGKAKPVKDAKGDQPSLQSITTIGGQAIGVCKQETDCTVWQLSGQQVQQIVDDSGTPLTVPLPVASLAGGRDAMCPYFWASGVLPRIGPPEPPPPPPPGGARTPKPKPDTTVYWLDGATARRLPVPQFDSPGVAWSGLQLIIGGKDKDGAGHSYTVADGKAVELKDSDGEALALYASSAAGDLLAVDNGQRLCRIEGEQVVQVDIPEGHKFARVFLHNDLPYVLFTTKEREVLMEYRDGKLTKSPYNDDMPEEGLSSPAYTPVLIVGTRLNEERTALVLYVLRDSKVTIVEQPKDVKFSPIARVEPAGNGDYFLITNSNRVGVLDKKNKYREIKYPGEAYGIPIDLMAVGTDGLYCAYPNRDRTKTVIYLAKP